MYVGMYVCMGLRIAKLVASLHMGALMYIYTDLNTYTYKYVCFTYIYSLARRHMSSHTCIHTRMHTYKCTSHAHAAPHVKYQFTCMYAYKHMYKYTLSSSTWHTHIHYTHACMRMYFTCQSYPTCDHMVCIKRSSCQVRVPTWCMYAFMCVCMYVCMHICI
jgi:hypothetical protein